VNAEALVLVRGGGVGVDTAVTVTAREDFDAFVLARGAALVRTARGLLRDPQHAEDVVQDVLVKAHLRWAHISRCDSPEAYVRRMLVNASIAFWRRAKRREFLMPDGTLPERAGPDESRRHDDRDLLLALLRRLPAKQRAVLVLRHYEDLPDAEIAEIMGTSVVTVRSNAHRGLARLRRLMQDIEEGGR